MPAASKTIGDLNLSADPPDTMRVLLLVHNLPEVGSYFRAAEIASRLARRGHEVELICIGALNKYRPRYEVLSADDVLRAGSPAEDQQAMRTRPVTPSPPGLMRVQSPYFVLANNRQEGWGIPDNAFRLQAALRRKWDLVYAFSHKPNCLLPMIAAKARGAKAVLDWSDWWGTDEGLYRACVIPSNSHQSLARPIRAWRRTAYAIEDFIEPHACRSADLVTLISEEFLAHPRTPRNLREKCYVFHSGSSLDAVTPQDKDQARARCGLEFPPDAIVLGYIANFHMAERLLLEAFALVCDADPRVHLLVVGADFDRTDPTVHEKIKTRLHHMGRRPFEEMTHYLAAADILLLPLQDIALDRARYPHKLSDYVAAGRPIIACDVGETGRLLRRYGFGVLSAAGSEAFAQRIQELSGEPESWEEHGKRSRAVAEEHFAWDRICGDLFNAISRKFGLVL